MKTKNITIILIGLSFLSFNAFAGRSVIKPKPRNNFPTAWHKVYEKNRINVRDCISMSCADLTTKSKVVLNQTPSNNPQRQEFVETLTDMKSAVIAGYEPIASAKQLGKKMQQADESMQGIVNAIYLSEKNKWPQVAKENLSDFMKNLIADGVNKEEAKKLKEVERNCKV